MRPRNPILAITEIADLIIRKNFQALRDYFDTNGQLDGFTFVEFSVTSNQDNLKIKHNLGFVPKDVLVSRLIAPSAAKLELNHGKFDSTNIDATITGLSSGETLACRLFVGSSKANDSDSQLSATDKQEYKH